MRVRLENSASRSSSASEYASSPEPITQMRTCGKVRSRGSTRSRNASKNAGSRNGEPALWVSASTNRAIAGGWCSTRSNRPEIVAKPSARTRSATRRLTVAGAYSRKSNPETRYTASSSRCSSRSVTAGDAAGPPVFGGSGGWRSAITLCRDVQPDANECDELVDVDGLGDVLRGTGREALLAVALHRLRGEREDREISPLVTGADAPDRLVAVHLRHHDVHQHDVDLRVRAQQPDRVGAGLRGEDVHLEVLERAAQRVDVASVVVGDEDRAAFERARVGRAAVHRPLDLGQPGLDLVEKIRCLFDQPLGRHRVLHDDRLGEAADRALLVFSQLAAGVHDHGDTNVRRVFLDALDQREAFDVGQPEIDDHAVELRFVERDERLRARGHRGDGDLARLDEVRHRRELRDVVLDDEHVARRRVREAEEVVERLRQRVLAGRLFEMRERTRVERFLPLLLAGDDVDGDRFGSRVALELIEQRPSVDVGQADVERDRVRDELARQRHAVGAGGRHQSFEAAVAREAEQDTRERRVVLHDQHDAVLRPDVVAVVVDVARRTRYRNRRERLRPRRNRHVLSDDALCARRERKGLDGPAGARRALQRVEERERRSDAGLGLHRHVAAQQAGDHARDREAQAGAAVFARGRHVGLLERFEDDVVLVGGDPDPRVAHFERDVRTRRPVDAAHLAVQCEVDGAVLRELERVRQQVLENLHQARLVGLDRVGDVPVDVDREAQAALLRHAAERPLDVVADVRDALLGDVDRGGAGLDLREVEDVVDEREQIGAGSPDGLRHLDLLVGEVLLAVVAELFGEDQQRVERRAQLVRHVGEKLRLVLRGERELFGLLLERAARFLDLAGAPLDLFVLLREQPRFLLELLVGLLQLVLLRLQLDGERLRLLEELLGAHVGGDRVEHDADRLRELVEEQQVVVAERLERRQLDDGLDVALEQHRQHDHVERLRVAGSRRHLQVVRGRVGDDDAFLLDDALPDEPFARAELQRAAAARRRVAGGVAQQRRVVDRFVEVEDAGLRVHQRRELRHDELRDRLDVFLALQHPGEPRQVGLEPVLLLVLARRVAQVADHLVHVLGEESHLALRADLDRAREVALRHRGRHLADRADLRRELRGELVDRVGQVAPQARGTGNLGLSAELSFEADLARDRRHLIGEDRERVDHPVDRVGELRDLALGVEHELALEISVRDARDDACDAAHLVRQVAGHAVHGVGEVFPRAGDAGYGGLAAEDAVGADLARYARDLARERVELLDHRVDGVLELEHLAAHVDGDFLRKVAHRDGGGDLRDVAHLIGQVRGHRVHRVGEIFPRAGDALHLRLAAEDAFGADLARHARHLAGERVELVDHRVDRAFELEDLAAGVDRDLLREVAARDGGRDVCDVANLRRQRRRHRVHRVGEVFPRAADAGHDGLAAELAVGADLARDARDFGGERVELVDHRVDGGFELEHLALDVDGDLLRKIALRDGGGDVGDVAHLRREVRRHEVDVVGEIFPRAGHALHVGLTAEPPFGADLARDAGGFRRERVELVDHRVDGAFELGHLAAHVDGDLLREIAAGDGGRHVRDVADLVRQVRGHRVHRVGEIFPRAGDAFDLRLTAELAFGADLARDARDLARERVELVDHRVDGRLELEHLALYVDRDLLREVAARDGRRHGGDVAHLVRQVAGHRVDGVRQIFPRAGNAAHVGLTAEPTVGTDLARDARDFRGERVELVDHRVDGRLELEHLAAHRHGDLLRKIAVRDGGRHLGDVANLRREVTGHRVDRVGQIFPRSGDAFDLRLAAEPAFGADFARDARDFARERVELVDHRVDGDLEVGDLALHVDGDLLRKIALGDSGRDLGDVAHLARQVARHRIDGVRQVFPRAGDAFHDRLTAQPSVRTHLARDARDFARERVELVDHRVDGAFELEHLAAHVDGDLLRKIALGDGCRDLGDVTHLAGEVTGHRVDGVGEIFPRPGHPSHVGLTAEPSFGPDLARDARDLGGERVELVDHRVDGLFELQDLAARFDGDLLRKVAVGDGGGDVGDVADLVGERAGHRVDRVGEVFPRARDAAHVRLAAEDAFGTDFARNARHLAGERVELIDHRVDRARAAQELALERAAVDFERHLLREVAARDRTEHAARLRDRMGEVVDQPVDREQLLAVSARRLQLSTLTEPAVIADDAGNALDLFEDARAVSDDFVERLRDVAVDAVPRGRQLGGEVTARDGAQRAQELALDVIRSRPTAAASDGGSVLGGGGALRIRLRFSSDGRRRHTRSPRAGMTERRRRPINGRSARRRSVLRRASYPLAASAKR